MSLIPTAEQSVIVDAARGTKENLRLIAYAGAAKTTTLELIANALTSEPILSLAFNKRIQLEMEKRLPGHVKALTLNSVGHRVWAAAQAKRLVLNPKKTYEHLQRQLEALPKERRWAYKEEFSDIMKMIAKAKTVGYIPEGKFSHVKPLTDRKTFEESFEDPIEPDVLELVDGVLTNIITSSYGGEIDFDDQIYMSTLFGGTFPRFPLVLVDESQDLNPINHAMLRKLVTKRAIIVGDPYQSIYGFRGAVHAGMDALGKDYSMTDMKLSTSFRCPREVVRRAWFRVPDMRWPEWAEEGKIHEPDSWGERDIPDGAAIICRNNAPLLRLGFQLIRLGRGVKIVGFDIGPGLIKTLRKFGPETIPQHQVYDAINRWEDEQLRKTRAKASTRDRAECFRIFASQGANLAAAIGYAEHIFAASGPIQLLSGHKAKGLEWDCVFFLDRWRCDGKFADGPEELEQERNVEYVITTRAKKELWYVDMENFSE